MLFKSIFELMPASGTVQMALTVKDGRMTVGLVPMFDGDDSPMVPLSMTGTPEEIDEKFVAAIREFTPAVQVVSENFEQARIAAEAKAAELKAKAEKSAKAASAAKGGSKPGANDIDARKDAPLDESHAAILATVPVTDTNFASALKAASQASLDAALNDPRLTTVGGLQAVAKELAKFRDETADKLLIPVLIAKVRAAENGVREALGKALEKASGKTLEEFGLAPKQLTLV
jgi:PRTRC genetic system protein E